MRELAELRHPSSRELDALTRDEGAAYVLASWLGMVLYLPALRTRGPEGQPLHRAAGQWMVKGKF